LSIPNAEPVTVAHGDVDTIAFTHEDGDTQAIPDVTFYSASGFVANCWGIANHWSIAECNDQRIAYDDCDSCLYRGCANAWRKPNKRSYYNGKEYWEPDTGPIGREWVFTCGGDCRAHYSGPIP
jgi:hypothetical protein